MTPPTISEIKELDKKEARLYHEMYQHDLESNKFKKERILELRELYLLKLELGLLEIRDKSDLCAYMWNRLLQHNITYSRGHFFELFKSDERRERKTLPDVHEWESVGDYEECKLHNGEIMIGGLIFDRRPDEIETEITQEWSSSDTKQTEIPEPFNTLLTLIENNAEQVRYIAYNIKLKCGDPDTKRAESVQKAVGESLDIQKEIKTQKEIEAKLHHTTHLTDFRERLGSYEKTMIRFYEVIWHLHQMGKAINISSKHIKNSVLSDGALVENLKIFRACPSCHTDIADLYNEAQIRKQKGLDPLPNAPVLKEIRYS